MSGQGIIVVFDKYTGRTAHPVDCPSVDEAHFVEKVIKNKRRNGRWYWASSYPAAAQELHARPCQCL